MDCPKCIGILKPFILNFRLVAETTTHYLTPRWAQGVSKTKTMRPVSKKQSLELDKCFVCKGIWFDKDELKKLRDLKIKKYRTLDSYIVDSKIYKQLNEKSGLCPRCKVPMLKIKGKNNLRKVTIDVCQKCKGTWLDGGEVNYIIKGNRSPKKIVDIFRRFFSSNTFTRY